MSYTVESGNKINITENINFAYTGNVTEITSQAITTPGIYLYTDGQTSGTLFSTINPDGTRLQMLLISPDQIKQRVFENGVWSEWQTRLIKNGDNDSINMLVTGDTTIMSQNGFSIETSEDLSNAPIQLVTTDSNIELKTLGEGKLLYNGQEVLTSNNQIFIPKLGITPVQSTSDVPFTNISVFLNEDGEFWKYNPVIVLMRRKKIKAHGLQKSKETIEEDDDQNNEPVVKKYTVRKAQSRWVATRGKTHSLVDYVSENLRNEFFLEKSDKHYALRDKFGVPTWEDLVTPFVKTESNYPYVRVLIQSSGYKSVGPYNQGYKTLASSLFGFAIRIDNPLYPGEKKEGVHEWMGIKRYLYGDISEVLFNVCFDERSDRFVYSVTKK